MLAGGVGVSLSLAQRAWREGPPNGFFAPPMPDVWIIIDAHPSSRSAGASGRCNVTGSGDTGTQPRLRSAREGGFNH